MATRDFPLAEFDVSKAAVQRLLQSLRLVNTAADALFYDVAILGLRLVTKGLFVSTDTGTGQFGAGYQSDALRALATHIVNLSALADPEGVILVIDAQKTPFVTRYEDVQDFLDAEAGPTARDRKRPVGTITITGVGSSALGSAAFAWNVSEALGEPVAAIVPGYGLADIVPQALGGWFGFGVHDFLREIGQSMINQRAPEAAGIGRRLSRSAPGAVAPNDKDPSAFRTGSPESDILHDILLAEPGIRRLYGHSKGALCIENAIRSLPDARTSELEVTTFGCTIEEETSARYDQILGRVDSLGQLNSWGNWPEHWILSWHSTNTMLPLTMPVAQLTKEGRGALRP